MIYIVDPLLEVFRLSLFTVFFGIFLATTIAINTLMELIKKDQKVNVKLTGKNNRLYESISGRVIGISPDAIYTEKENPYYEIRIETAQDYFDGGEEKYYMYPGTQVSAMIEIGSRTIADYIFESTMILINFKSRSKYAKSKRGVKYISSKSKEK